MPARSPQPCSHAGCGKAKARGAGTCATHTTQAEQQRGTATQRGYGQPHQGFRRQVLASQPRCVLCGNTATVADHHPLSRRQLVAGGMDPNNPAHGRGLCAPCHGQETARLQPGHRWGT